MFTKGAWTMQRPIARGPHPDNDSDTIVATIWKSQREAIVVRACVFNGYASINTRIAYRAKESDDLRYTKEGFTTKPGAETEQLIQALTKPIRPLSRNSQPRRILQAMALRRPIRNGEPKASLKSS